MKIKIEYVIGVIFIIGLIYGIATFDFQNPGSYDKNVDYDTEWLPDMDSIPEPMEIWIPDSRLLNSEFWKQVGPYRFECEFLKLAIGWTGNGQYALMEMEGEKRVLALSSDYGDIQKIVTKLTLKK